MKALLISFTILFSSYSHISYGSEKSDIEYRKGFEFVYLPYFFAEIGYNLNDSPLTVRGRFGAFYITIFATTEISIDKLLFDKYDVFFAVGAHALWTATGVTAQIGTEIPASKEGAFWRLGLSYGKFDLTPDNQNDSDSFYLSPIIGYTYSF